MGDVECKLNFAQKVGPCRRVSPLTPNALLSYQRFVLHLTETVSLRVVGCGPDLLDIKKFAYRSDDPQELFPSVREKELGHTMSTYPVTTKVDHHFRS